MVIDGAVVFGWFSEKTEVLGTTRANFGDVRGKMSTASKDANALENYWEILGLEPGASTTDVQKAYRKKSLAVHPDRYKGDNPEWATEEFLRLTRAKEVLEDDKARAAFEALQKARAAHREKQEQQNAGRKKLREDLEAREEAARKRQRTSTEAA